MTSVSYAFPAPNPSHVTPIARLRMHPLQPMLTIILSKTKQEKVDHQIAQKKKTPERYILRV